MRRRLVVLRSRRGSAPDGGGVEGGVERVPRAHRRRAPDGSADLSSEFGSDLRHRRRRSRGSEAAAGFHQGGAGTAEGPQGHQAGHFEDPGSQDSQSQAQLVGGSVRQSDAGCQPAGHARVQRLHLEKPDRQGWTESQDLRLVESLRDRTNPF